LPRQAEVLPRKKEGTNFDKLRRRTIIIETGNSISATLLVASAECLYMSDKLLVLTTAGSQAEARKLALALVDRRQAACVNIVPGVESIYQWKGKTEQAEEWMLLIKTNAAVFDLVRETIKELHSYELAECISVSIGDGSPEYLRWIADSIG
jgi:periplasmic divalent cation tolerance protein